MKNFLIIILTFFSLSLISSGYAQDESNEPEYEMKTYYFVFLKRGTSIDIDSTKLAEIQKAHLANIQRLADEGKLSIAGPFLDDSDLRGIFILNASSMEEAVEWVETDPAIKAGRLSYEIKPWYGAKGSVLK